MRYLRLRYPYNVYFFKFQVTKCRAIAQYSDAFQIRGKTGILFFINSRKTVTQRKKWIHLCKRKDPISVENARIYGLYFKADVHERNMMYELLGKPVPQNQIKMKKGPVPTLNLPVIGNSFTSQVK